MSVNLKTNCKNCVHEKVCRNNGMPELFKRRIENTNYDIGPNDDYGLDTISDRYHITIDISCNDFEKSVPVPRGAFK